MNPTPRAVVALVATASSLLMTPRPACGEDLWFVFQKVPQREAPGTVVGGYALSYGRRATPPLAPDGVEHDWFAGFQVLERLQARLNAALVTHERLSGQAWRVGGEVRALLLERERSGVDVAVTAGYLREVQNAHLITGSVQVAGAAGPVELAGTVAMEKAFAAGRDAVDVIVTSGASYAVARFASIGVEYQGQDLEDLWEREEAEGGARHLLGPSATFRFLSGRVSTGAGLGFGLTRNSPDVVVRTMFVATF